MIILSYARGWLVQRLIRFALMPLLIMYAASTQALTYYVDGWSGSNTNDGSSAVVTNGHGPLRNISAALAISGGADTIQVAAGFYQETNWPSAGQTLQLSTNGTVYVYDGDPLKTDSDFDGMPDAWEAAQGLDPFNSGDASETSTNPFAHGLTNLQVYLHQSVLIADNHSTAGDGIPDWWKVKHGFSVTDPSVGLADADRDRYSNRQEYHGDTDPQNGASYPTNVVPEFIGWWPFDEGSGTNAASAVGTNLVGTLIGDTLPSWTSGVFSNALTFDGLSNEVVVANDPQLSASNTLSVTAWVKTATNTTSEVVAQWSTNQVAGSYILSLTNGQVALELMINGSYTAVVGQASSLSDTNWHFIAGTYDGAEMRVYLDATQVGSLAATGAVDIVDISLRLGLLAGKLDDSRIYNPALSATDIAALYNQDTDGDGIPDYWEINFGLDPLNPYDAALTSAHPWAHGLTNLQVYQNPSVLIADNHSTLNDGIPDWWKVKYGFGVNDTSVTHGDADSDGVDNMTEYLQGRDPTKGAVPDTGGLVNLSVYTPLE